jgi:hypothetical protein
MVFDVFGYTVYFVFRFVHFYLWIRARNRIYLSTLLLFLEDRPFSDANCELNRRGITLFSEEKT